MAERRNENREDAKAFLRQAEDAETGRGRGDEVQNVDYFVNESADWRSAFIGIGGAITHALLDLADAIRSTGK